MKKYFRYSALLLIASLPFIVLPRAGHVNAPEIASSSPQVAPLTQVANSCDVRPAPTFDVLLPKVGVPPDHEGQGWARPKVWGDRDDEATDDRITVPNGRPIYALFVSGYGQNGALDQLLFFNFARYLMARGAYVHYAWWNNLLAPYMERPLHHSQSYPGALPNDILNFTTAAAAANKAFPGEDYQFVSDATRFISAIREHNPSAMIVVVGHSMGGGAIVHLEKNTNILIDLLAPIDPVGNRNYPWAGVRPAQSDFNWTRWRITRDNFLGYKSAELRFNPLRCEPVGPWLKDYTEATADIGCSVFVHNSPREEFRQNVVNVQHRWQTEFLFPFDYHDAYFFSHLRPPGGITSQEEVPLLTLCGGLPCSEPGGWPLLGDLNKQCCENLSNGVSWPQDGHGEIVGYRGPGTTVALADRVRTSTLCGDDCTNKTWPGRTQTAGGFWITGDSASRAQRLKALELLPANSFWPDSPRNPDLCRVSPGLIARFGQINKPPVANAGPDQTVECTSHHGTPVTLNGVGSTDPDNDQLEYQWTWQTGQATGPVVTITLPKGTHCISLQVRDPSGHIDRDVTTVTIQDTTPPELTVSLRPRLLWPPNHIMWTIYATVRAVDRCDESPEVVLTSVVSNQPDNGTGDGDTVNDIQGVALNTLDLVFLLRAERAGPLGDRRYTATYRATDEDGNSSVKSASVIVPHNQGSFDRWMSVLEKPKRGARMTGEPISSDLSQTELTQPVYTQDPSGVRGVVIPIVKPDGNSNAKKAKRKRKPRSTVKQLNALQQ